MKPTYGNKQSYLGLKFKITDDKNLEINMIDQNNDILDEFSEKIWENVIPYNKNVNGYRQIS